LLPRNILWGFAPLVYFPVSIADATLASSQLPTGTYWSVDPPCFNRRRDACFLATSSTSQRLAESSMFQSQTRRLLPRNEVEWRGSQRLREVSIADATLASSQPYGTISKDNGFYEFQSQTRRLLPRNSLTSSISISACPCPVSIADATLASSQRCLCLTKKQMVK